ncbi:MAG: PIN domain-containing protein [Kiritimatiellaeota bacterium]|nr:PIN domain-containing protein [Kiritimatiellota bacterium]
MVVYADTSFLFSLYTNDTNSAQADEAYVPLQAPIALTALQQHELCNALCLSVFRGKMTLPEKHKIQASIAMDIQDGVLQEFQIDWAKAYACAGMLSEAYTPEIGCRASDILHVALAQMLRVRYFYSFDIRQRSLAQKVGLNVKPK